MANGYYCDLAVCSGRAGAVSVWHDDGAHLDAHCVRCLLTRIYRRVLFRVIIQCKLELALGQDRAWFYSGILFGLFHVPINFFRPQWYSSGESYLAAFIMLFGQISAGWIFGIIYSKTRSIFPGMLAHFMTDARLSSIVLNLIP
ncbi:MAG: CPBP family intramembrane metalloprotease [Marinosulfonomonas sp.]|nr:CPBP family intramembrane metalloprotease [Marinosulfonomonas sp.]